MRVVRLHFCPNLEPIEAYVSPMEINWKLLESALARVPGDCKKLAAPTAPGMKKVHGPTTPVRPAHP